MDGLNQTNTAIPQTRTPLAASPPPPQAAPPQAPTDRVVLQKADDGIRTYTRERDAAGIEYQKWQGKSGASYEVATTPEGTRFHAEIPAGLTDQPLEITGAWSKEGSAAIAHPAGKPDQAVQAQITPDGKIAVALAPNGPMAMFDPGTLDYGFSTPPQAQAQAGPNGRPVVFQAMQEVVHADNSHTIKANATVTEEGGGVSFNMLTGVMPKMPHRETSYLEINDRNGQVTAKQVTETEALNPQQPGFMGQVNNLMSGSGRTEQQMVAQRMPDGSYTISGNGDLMSHMKDSLKNPFSFQSPVGNWMKGRNQQAVPVRTFSSNPLQLSALGAAAGPAAAMAAQMPLPAAPGAIPPPPPLAPPQR